MVLKGLYAISEFSENLKTHNHIKVIGLFSFLPTFLTTMRECLEDLISQEVV